MARTKITNTSGETRHFGYVPPHGTDIEDGAYVTVEGDLRTVLAGGRGRYSRTRELTALDEDVDAGNVTIEELPDPSSSSSSP